MDIYGPSRVDWLCGSKAATLGPNFLLFCYFHNLGLFLKPYTVYIGLHLCHQMLVLLSYCELGLAKGKKKKSAD